MHRKKIFLRVLSSKLYEQLMVEPLLVQLIQDRLPPVQVKEVYYDTSQGDLSKQGVLYRVCQWMTPQKSKRTSSPKGKAQPCLKAFRLSCLGRRLVGISADNRFIKPFLTCRLERKTFHLVLPEGTLAELVAESGIFIAERRRRPFFQLSFSLRQGSMAAVFHLATTLSKLYPLMLENQARPIWALNFSCPIEEKNLRPIREIKSRDEATKSLRRILLFYLQLVLTAQQSFLGAPDDPESLHQFRVRLRQLRSILSFGKPLFNQVIFLECQSGLRQMGRELSYVREMDVLAAQWEEVLADIELQFPGPTQLTDFLARERTKNRKRLFTKLRKGKFTPVLLTLWQRLLESPWNYQYQSLVSTADFTEHRLVVWLKKFHKAWRSTPLADRDSLHKLRIKGKKLRYVMEGLAWHTKRDNRRIQARLKEVQELLGLLNDAYRSNILIKNLISHLDGAALHVEAGILMGWQAGRAAHVQKKLQEYQRQSLLKKTWQ
jgi:triphosphatase